MQEFKTVIDGKVYQFSSIKKSKFALKVRELGANIGHLKFSQLNIITIKKS